MGLLNNWLKKKEKEQLVKAGEKQPKVMSAKKQTEEKDKTEAVEEKKIKKAVSKQKEDAKTKKTLPAGSIAHEVLLKPLVTEKGAIAESHNKYSFMVARWADKSKVRKAVKDIYGVMPIKVNVVNVDGKSLRFGRSQGKRSDYKKAIVTLPNGKSIDIHAGV